MNNSYNGHLVIVFALEHYNPLNMIRAFGEQGINPVYISVVAFPKIFGPTILNIVLPIANIITIIIAIL